MTLAIGLGVYGIGHLCFLGSAGREEAAQVMWIISKAF